MQTLTSLPDNLPMPLDDGACANLSGTNLPAVDLIATNGVTVNLAAIKGWLVVYCYPMTGQPDKPLPAGWDEIAGARGCTPQSCTFRDHYQALQQLNAQVFGLSVQSTDFQQEVVDRLHLPYALLSDAHFKFTDVLNLPTFEVDKMRLIKRVTLIAFNGVIQHCFYPVFPPDKNAEAVINWLKLHA